MPIKLDSLTLLAYNSKSSLYRLAYRHSGTLLLLYIVLLRLFDLHLSTLFEMVLKESPLSTLLHCHYIQ